MLSCIILCERLILKFASEYDKAVCKSKHNVTLVYIMLPVCKLYIFRLIYSKRQNNLGVDLQVTFLPTHHNPTIASFIQNALQYTHLHTHSQHFWFDETKKCDIFQNYVLLLSAASKLDGSTCANDCEEC